MSPLYLSLVNCQNVLEHTSMHTQPHAQKYVCTGPKTVFDFRSRNRILFIISISAMVCHWYFFFPNSSENSQKICSIEAIFIFYFTANYFSDIYYFPKELFFYNQELFTIVYVVVQSLSCVRLFETPETAAHPGFPVLHYVPELAQFMSAESVMPSNHLVLCLLRRLQQFRFQ